MATNSALNPSESNKERSPPSASAYLQDSGEVQKVFEQFDRNGDGRISVAELDDVLKALGTAVPAKDLQRVMEDLDSDRDGFISVAEFAAFCRRSADDGGASELRDAFDLYDQDHNGLISAVELRDVLCRLGMSVTVDDCHRMIASVDADGDGNVNFDEFCTMMTNSVGSAATKA